LLAAAGRFCAGFDINQFVQASGGGGIDDRINDAFCDLVESGATTLVQCNATPGSASSALIGAATQRRITSASD